MRLNQKDLTDVLRRNCWNSDKPCVASLMWKLGPGGGLGWGKRAGKSHSSEGFENGTKR